MAKLAEMILTKYGPLGLVLIVFLGMWTGWIPSPITESRALLIKIDDAQSKLISVLAGELQRSRASDERLVQVFRMICVRVSKTESQTEECWGWKQ
jgi:hypothetical protein